MTSAASLVNAPAARLSAGEGRSASQPDRDDDFARILDDERALRDRVADVETAQPAPAPSPPVEAPEQPEPVQANEGQQDEPSADAKATTTAEFQAALNNLNSDDDATTTKGAATEQPVTDTANADAAANAAKPAATATAAASATQPSAALLILANANGGTTASGDQAADEDDISADTGTSEGSATDGSAIAALAGVAQPVTTQAVTQAVGATGEGDGSIKPATPNGAGTDPVAADVAAQADANGAAKDGKPADASAQGASPAAAQANAHPAASSATQATAPAAAAVSTDNAAQAATNAGSAASQAAAQPAATSNPPTDATRAAATPPALQSAPAATIQVYTRFIERADGRAQRFDVRLDPAELGRVDVRIEIGADKKVHAVMAAHDSAALTDLMRGQKALERALSDAGIDLAENGLRFEIAADSGRGGASQQREGDANGRSGQPDAWRKFDTATISVSAEAAAATMPTRRSQRLDLVA
ncbi:MAG: flagellar hook-length control protein FliK [Hyphomonadaceae bacterium]